MKVRMVIIGGFLGAGKTTMITKLAMELRACDVNVGVIMNDQADALVDTQYAEALGLDSCEVSGGCFCCRFPDFMRNAEKLLDASKPQIVIAEPVGSCTDLLATVVAPLRALYADRFEVSPLIIMIDVARALEEGFDQSTLGGYLRHHQLDEAEVIVLSKADLVDAGGLSRVRSVVQSINPEARLITYSSVTGEGVDQVLEIVRSNRASVRRPQDIDYDLYAKAEAELGWYNATLQVNFATPTDAFVLGRDLLQGFSSKFSAGDIAHAKIMLTSERNAMKMSCVQGRVTVDVAKGSRFAMGPGRLTVNARVVSAPQELKRCVRDALREKLKLEEPVFEAEECFAPSPPKPFHRLTD